MKLINKINTSIRYNINFIEIIEIIILKRHTWNDQVHTVIRSYSSKNPRFLSTLSLPYHVESISLEGGNINAEEDVPSVHVAMTGVQPGLAKVVSRRAQPQLKSILRSTGEKRFWPCARVGC